jgi:sec-independent protein translocase protein TatB
MFDIGWSELALIGAVALVVIGPKELPGVLRTVGGAVSKMRRMAGEFQSQFQEALREAELDEAKKTIGGLNDQVNSLAGGFNPIQAIRDEIKGSVDSVSGNPTLAPAPGPDASSIPALAPDAVKPAAIASSGSALASEGPLPLTSDAVKAAMAAKRSGQPARAPIPAAPAPMDEAAEAPPRKRAKAAVAESAGADLPAKPRRVRKPKATAPKGSGSADSGGEGAA